MTCLPIVFGIDVKDNFPIFFGCFYKFVISAYKNNWPIIAQDEYFADPKVYKSKYGINLNDVYSINEIEAVDMNVLNSVDKFIINEDLTNKVIKEFNDKDNAWLKLMNVKSKVLFKELDKILPNIIKKYNKIDCIIVWRHNETIAQIARKYNIKMLEMELSGVRKPDYRCGLCYFQFSNKYSCKEFEFRYKKFCKELEKSNLNLLSRDEIVELLFQPQNIKYYKSLETYDFGVALGLQKDYETLSTNSPTNEFILNNIPRLSNSILIRKHPANYSYIYENESLFNIDSSHSSLEFISKCKKIVSSVSNICFEAMIMGKTTYTLGKMPFKRFSYNTLKYNDEYVINIVDLNFLTFCYYVPYSLSLDPQYINFRLNNPTELDIYRFHLNYLLNNFKIQKCDISYSHTRFNNLCDEIRKLEDDRDNILKLCKDNEQLIKKQADIIIENNNLLNRIYNSTSWRITKPIRYIKSMMNRLKGK